MSPKKRRASTNSTDANPIGSPEIIVRSGCEGGDWTLFGFRQNDGSWKYSTESNEAALADMLPEGESPGGPWCSKSSLVDTWEKALELFDRYEWANFHPVEVHPEFRDRVWKAVQSRMKRKPDHSESGFSLRQWKELCGKGSSCG